MALLCQFAQENPTTFLLEMNSKVGAENMVSAIAESVSPHHLDESEVDNLESLIFKGVSEKCAAVKGTKIQFECNPEMGVDVSMDRNEQGNVPSPGLAVCLNNCCSPKNLHWLIVALHGDGH